MLHSLPILEEGLVEGVWGYVYTEVVVGVFSVYE